jgi:hypothetical protein
MYEGTNEACEERFKIECQEIAHFLFVMNKCPSVPIFYFFPAILKLADILDST